MKLVKKKFFAWLMLTLLCANGCLAQTPAPGPLNTSDYTRRLIAEHLDRPEAVVPLADNVVLVAERSGRILLLDGDHRTDLGQITVPGMSIFYVPERSYTEGLKDLIAVSGQPGVFVWGMTTGTAQARQWTIGRAKINRNAGQLPTMENEILWQSEVQKWTHGSLPPFSGCRLLVKGSDVITAMGANSRAEGVGQIMQISLTGSHAPRLISTGHRNPSGIVVFSNVLWEVEHGPKGGDELNIIVEGSDYGWPVVSEGEPDDAFHHLCSTRSPSSSVRHHLL